MNIIEHIRLNSVNNLFSMNSFSNSFPKWKIEIKNKIGANPNFHDILGLGDFLEQIFKSTRSTTGRSQSAVSSGGTAWEGLVCWYLNLCLIGSRTVVIKHSKKLIPPCIADAITVNYGSFISNTESDLIAITFPNNDDFLEELTVFNTRDYLPNINQLCKDHFDKLEVGIIQCKTNWNDNAQIPMLWGIVYASRGFSDHNISVGRNGFSLKEFNKFFYAFVTLPSGKDNYKANSVAVKRVQNLSGGNYWGKISRSGVASSLKEIFGKNFTNSSVLGTQKKDVEAFLVNKEKLNYFNLSL